MKTRSGFLRARMRRALSLLLAAVMLLGFLPGIPGAENSTAEAQWAEPYLNQLVEWGFIRADQANNPNLALTRADFMAIVNRAYGYSTPGETPFEDVEPNKWYYDDVGIAYTARYIVGTSPTTASPNDPLTRETAATVLGRNMMLQESPGEILEFTDSRQISNWAMGTVKSSLEHYLISGYTDGTLRPKRNVSWGEMAAMVTNLVGTPLQEAGDYALGGVFGNVTITSSNVTLRDSVVSGDSYVTGGVGLGNVKMENVDVMGRIIASGTGRSEGGEASILLRNVTAGELLIDNLQDDYVSVQVDGISEIDRTTVRTSAYIEDNTPDGMGLKYISIEGDTYPEGEEPEGWEPIQVDLAGRLGEVVNRTPKSQVRVAKGTVEKLTVDEAATDSTVIIDRGAVVKELALDTATTVTGEGDIGHLIVNAPGCVIDIMPDQITIRPGITAIICGEEMDSMAAEEFSMEPRILAGYPEARDITPTGLEAVFMTNKAGTVYYAVSALTDGSVGEDDLIKPPSYGSIAVVSGSVKVNKGNEEVSAAIGGLTPGGSYYLSAVLVDAKGNRSPVKVISFTTPDNSIPAFVDGYPYMSKVSPSDSVVVTKTTKDCKLYYALLPQGAVAPTEAEMRANAVAGALGYGVRDAYKNIEDIFRVNDQLLEEQKTYILYFFLMDADGVNKSAILSLTFTTDDETPPIFIVEPTVNSIQETSVGLTFRLNEDGTVYWVAIPANTMAYPKPEPGTDYEIAPPNSMYGKLQIANGMNIGTNGKSGKVTCKANVDGTITVSGLEKSKAYDFYYVAKDNAGTDRNYSEIWKKITIYTLDTEGPVFSQSFSDSSSLDGKSDPRANTAIYLDVTEDIRYTGEGGGTSFLELYKAVKEAKTDAERNAAKNKLAQSLYGAIKLHKIELSSGSTEPPIVPSKWQTTGQFTNDDEWTIDYTQAIVEAHEGGIRITFPKSALHLENGGQYYFTVANVTDVSNNQNPVVPSPVDFYLNETASKTAGHDLPIFLVEFARVDFSRPGVGAGDAPIQRDANGTPITKPTGGYTDDDYVRMDMSFRLTPISTETVSDNISYDLLLWTYNQVKFDLYYRVVDASGKKILNGSNTYPVPYSGTNPSTQEKFTANNYLLPRLGGRDNTPDENGWIYLGNSDRVNPSSSNRSGRSVNKYFNGCGEASFPRLNTLSSNLRYEFVIHLTALGTIDEETNGEKTWRNWNGDVVFYANVAAGQSSQLDDLGGSLSDTKWNSVISKGLNGGAVSIGRNDTREEPLDTQELSRSFTDSRLPRFANNAPRFVPQDHSVEIDLSFSNPGILYYMVGKADMGEPDHLPEVTTTRTLLSNSAYDVPADTATMLPVTGGDGLYYIRLTDGLGGRLAPNKNGAEPMQLWMVGPQKGSTPEERKDDPEEKNLIVSPLNQYVFDPQGQADTANTIHGDFPFKGNVIEKLNITGLEAETDYYIYFVLKGEADTLSHVYLYQFRTLEAKKPKIEVEGDSQGAKITVKADNESKMRYYVFDLAEAKAMIPLLRDSSTIEVSEAYYNAVKNGDKKDIVKAGTDSSGKPIYTMSVLDAIAEIYYGEDPEKSTETGCSVFDVFATDTMKRDVASFLRSNNPNRGNAKIITRGGETIAAKDYDPREVYEENGKSPFESGTDYVIIAMAWDSEGDENDASIMSFAGARPIPEKRGGAPVVIDARANLDVTKESDKGYYGTIEVLFDKQVYTSDGHSLDEAGIIKDAASWIPGGTSNHLYDRLMDDGGVTVNKETRIRLTGWWKNNDEISIPGYQICSTQYGSESNNRAELRIVVKVTSGVGVTVTVEWVDRADPSQSDKWVSPFEFQTSKDVSVTFRVSPGYPGEMSADGKTFTVDLGNESTSVTAWIEPSDLMYSGTWAVTKGKDSVIRISSDTDRRAELELVAKGTATIEYTLEYEDSDGSTATKKYTLTVEVTSETYKLTGITASVGKVMNGAVTWDLSQPSATITITSDTPLPKSLNVATQTSVTSGAIKLTSAKIDSTRKKISLQVAVKGNVPANKKDTIVVEIGQTTCTIPVTYEGSQTSGNQSGIKINTKS